MNLPKDEDQQDNRFHSDRPKVAQETKSTADTTLASDGTKELALGCFGLLAIASVVIWIVSWYINALNKPDEAWLCYSENQQKFVEVLSPINKHCTKIIYPSKDN